MNSTQRWTVGAYLAGGENLSREMILALHDMRDVALGNRSELRVLAQFNPDGKAPRIFAFDEDDACHLPLATRPGAAGAPPTGLANYEFVLELESSGPESSELELLAQFIELSRARAGSGPLLVVVSGHANGTVGEFLGHRNGARPLYLADLKNALKPGEPSSKKIDVLGMDCCHMGMVEVCSEAAPYARFLVASEGYILNHGWPYRATLESIPGLAPEEAASEIVRQYIDSYGDYTLVDFPSHCAVCDLTRMPLLEASMNRLGRLLIEDIGHPDVWRPTVLAHWEAQSYKDEEYVDLFDFCHRLRIHIGDPEIQSACAAVMQSVSEVVRSSLVSGSTFQFSHGLSIYFPWCNDLVKRADGKEPSELERYRELDFSRKTGWGEFLDAYLWATRREPSHSLDSEYSRSLNPSSDVPSGTKLQKEVPMEPTIKRAPPWNIKRGAGTRQLKNHPLAQNSSNEIPNGSVGPWITKGGVLGPSRIKNHPVTKEK